MKIPSFLSNRLSENRKPPHDYDSIPDSESTSSTDSLSSGSNNEKGSLRTTSPTPTHYQNLTPSTQLNSTRHNNNPTEMTQSPLYASYGTLNTISDKESFVQPSHRTISFDFSEDSNKQPAPKKKSPKTKHQKHSLPPGQYVFVQDDQGNVLTTTDNEGRVTPVTEPLPSVPKRAKQAIRRFMLNGETPQEVLENFKVLVKTLKALEKENPSAVNDIHIQVVLTKRIYSNNLPLFSEKLQLNKYAGIAIGAKGHSAYKADYSHLRHCAEEVFPNEYFRW